ncbi:hypothetical protein CcaCcLH18_13219 [Colletotrichum camelliae]|nr:hypothetical protein CcaCcLH18_13219 [Colletotrichum camelliae]
MRPSTQRRLSAHNPIVFSDSLNAAIVSAPPVTRQHENAGRLDVSMDNVVMVNVAECFKKLLQNFPQFERCKTTYDVLFLECNAYVFQDKCAWLG